MGVSEGRRITMIQNNDTISRQAALDAVFNNAEHPDKAYEAIRHLPSAQPEPKWIPCSERLPLEYTRVIGYMAWKAMTAIEYQHGRWYSIDHLEPLPDEAVSHWMPLPKPPKEGDE